jgi:hypothetical protein
LSDAASAPAEPGVVIVKSTVGAGLGDRLRAVLAAVLYAEHSGRRVHVMWDDGLYGPEAENVFPQLLRLRGMDADGLDLSQIRTTRPAFWAGWLEQPMKVLYRQYGPPVWNRREAIARFSFDQSRLDYAEDALVMWEFDQFGACVPAAQAPPGGACWGNRAFVAALARDHLAPAPRVRERIQAFQARHFRQPMIGVHVRLSNEPQARSKQVPESRYRACIRRVRRQHPAAGIFLATDNRAVQERFLARYGDAVVTTDKWFGQPGEPLHRAADKGDRLENAVEALTDLFLLAACEYLIFPAQSSFSLTASYFSAARPSNILPLTQRPGLAARLGLARLSRLWSLRAQVGRLRRH